MGGRRMTALTTSPSESQATTSPLTERQDVCWWRHSSWTCAATSRRHGPQDGGGGAKGGRLGLSAQTGFRILVFDSFRGCFLGYKRIWVLLSLCFLFPLEGRQRVIYRFSSVTLCLWAYEPRWLRATS